MRTFLVWKQVFPSCCSNHRVLISLNWSVVSDFKPTVTRWWLPASCLSFEQTDLAESRDRNHNNTLSSDCCPITPQHERQFATYECGVNDPRVCLVICTSLEKCRFRSPKVIGFHYKSYNDQTSLPEFSVWMFAGVSASLLTLCTVGQDGYKQGFWRRCQMDQGAQMGLHLVQTLCTGIRKKAVKTPYAIKNFLLIFWRAISLNKQSFWRSFEVFFPCSKKTFGMSFKSWELFPKTKRNHMRALPGEF